MTQDFSEYRRYGSAVTTVGNLTPTDLIDLQNEGFVSIYSAPWRWVPMLQKHGVIGGTLMLVRVARLLSKKFYGGSGASHDQLVSLGDGAFGHIQDPAMAMAPAATPSASAPSSGPLLQIAPSAPRATAPAGHFGDPRNPNG